jgi:hypothetical protein
MHKKLAVGSLILWFALTVFLTLATASDSGNPPTVSTSQQFSADDFDWREMVPALAAAVELPADQGVKELLENSGILRAYIVSEIRDECLSNKNRCPAMADRAALEREVTGRIDAIAAKSILTQRKTEVVDYTLARQPFPFSEIAAYESQNQRGAYFTLSPSGHTYTSLRVKAKYGVPFDDDIFQWYGVYKYRLDNADYRSEAVFEIDPASDAVVKIAISFKPKKHHRSPSPKPPQPF